MKKTFSQNRLLFYLIIMGFIPLIFVIQNHLNKKKELASTRSHLENVERLSLISKKKQAGNEIIRKIFTGADHYYIDHHLETLSFLQKEKNDLEKILSSNAFPGDEKIISRYYFLTGEGNRLVFRESGIETGEGIEETLETLAHSIEVDIKDLKKILHLVEGKDLSLHPPQMLITDFSIRRKVPVESEIFELDMKLVKREFSK